MTVFVVNLQLAAESCLLYAVVVAEAVFEEWPHFAAAEEC